MKALHDEIFRRFPELVSRIHPGDEDLPYSLMIYLADWLKDLAPEAFTADLVQRLVAFTQWCLSQPEGKTASDDLHTILVVGFYEHLFDAESTRALLPHFISREEMLQNAEYLRSWVGVEDYEKALREYNRRR